MERKLYKEREGRWAELTVKLVDGRLSMTCVEGEVLLRSAAKRRALDYWTSDFEDCPEEIWAMAQRFGKAFRTAKAAARFVLETDGELHGLDVEREDAKRVWISESSGQHMVAAWFPEAAPYLQYHLNDMKASCEHQEALGWPLDIYALDRNSATEAQLATLDGDLAQKAEQRQLKELEKRREMLRLDRNYRLSVMEAVFGDKSVYLDELLAGRSVIPFRGEQARQKADLYLRALIAQAYPALKFEADIFRGGFNKNYQGAPCPVCGYRYGSAWLRRELPAEVVAWVEGLPEAA